jgi:hypothetical protein
MHHFQAGSGVGGKTNKKAPAKSTAPRQVEMNRSGASKTSSTAVAVGSVVLAEAGKKTYPFHTKDLEGCWVGFIFAWFTVPGVFAGSLKSVTENSYERSECFCFIPCGEAEYVRIGEKATFQNTADECQVEEFSDPDCAGWHCPYPGCSMKIC